MSLPLWSPLLMWLFIALAIGIPGILLIRKDRWRAKKSCSLHCPRHHREFDACIVVDTKSGRALHVIGCDAWLDWSKVGCGAPCLPELNASQADRAQSRPSDLAR